MCSRATLTSVALLPQIKSYDDIYVEMYDDLTEKHSTLRLIKAVLGAATEQPRCALRRHTYSHLNMHLGTGISPARTSKGDHDSCARDARIYGAGVF